MSKLAPVVPTHIAETLQKGDRDYLQGYHLLLAHDIIDKPVEYQRIYGRVRNAYPDSFIILDNSIIELGKPMEIKDLLRATEILRPDCLVIPDVMGDGEGTRKSAIKFIREYSQEAYKTDKDPISLMGVVQGNTVDDVMETLGVFYLLPFVEYIGIPRVITKQHGSRMPTLMAMQRSPVMAYPSQKAFKGFHLLGFSDDILDDVSCARVSWIQGIDSNVPVRAAMKYTPMDLHNGKQWSEKVGPRGDFWTRELPKDVITNGKVTDEGTQVLKMIHKNLDDYRGWIAN